MSLSNGLLTAAGVVGVGALAAVAYAQVQKGVALGAGTKAARDLAAAGGDPNAVNTLVDVLRAAGGAAGGAVGAAQDALSNENSGAQGAAVLDSARAALAKAGRPSQLYPNLRVVRPLDRSSQWRIGEGCWLPPEGAAQGWRTEPQSLVRGFGLGYALTYLPDVYPAPAGGGSVIAYAKRHGYEPREYFEGDNLNKRRGVPWSTPEGERNAYEIMVTSTAQAGRVALYDPNRGGLVPEDEPVQFAISATMQRKRIAQSGGELPYRNWMPSSFLRELRNALENAIRFMPWPSGASAADRRRLEQWLQAQNSATRAAFGR